MEMRLAQPGAVSLEVYAVDGRRVRTLASGWREAGFYQVTWDGRDERRATVAPGIYFARLSAAGKLFTAKLVHLK